MNAIYEPRGAAREYAPLALNLFSGCSHGCGYCYVPQCLRRDREEFHATMTVREGVLEQVVKDAKRLAGDPRTVLLSFTSDPYPVGRPDLHAVTRQALTILRAHGLHWSVLTKGGAEAQADFDLYRAGDWFSTTLTCFDQETEAAWEPGAECGPDRADNLLMAWEHGISTWVSMEPVIAPDALDWICILTDYVDLWRIGKWNYSPEAAEIDWRAFGQRLAGVLLGTGVRYYIKDSLRPFMPPGFAYENWPPEMRPEEARS